MIRPLIRRAPTDDDGDDGDDDDGGLAGLMSPSDSPPPRPPKSANIVSRADSHADPNALANNPFASALVSPSPTHHSAGADRKKELAVWRLLLERLEAAIAAKQYVADWVAIGQRKPVSVIKFRT